MQREVETFSLLLLSALCLSTDRSKLHLGFSLLHFWVPTPNCFIECQQTEGKDSMGSRMREIKRMELIQFLISVCLAQLSSIRVCNSPNLEPPDCNQIHSVQPCEIQVVWMKLSFWAPHGFSGWRGKCVTTTLGGTQGPRAGTHSAVGKEKGAGNCSCHGERVLMEVLTLSLGVCQSPCS